MKTSLELRVLMEKHAQVVPEGQLTDTRPVMSKTMKHVLSGAAAGVTGLPLLQPLDNLITRIQAKHVVSPTKGFQSLISKHWGGVTPKSLKIGLGMGITFAAKPIYQAMLDKRYRN